MLLVHAGDPVRLEHAALDQVEVAPELPLDHAVVYHSGTGGLRFGSPPHIPSGMNSTNTHRRA
jgi:hypothetical protein